MAASKRKGVSRRDLFGSLFRSPKNLNDPDPDEATLSVHSQDRVQELLEHLKEKNPAPPHTMPREQSEPMPRQKPEETD